MAEREDFYELNGPDAPDADELRAAIYAGRRVRVTGVTYHGPVNLSYLTARADVEFIDCEFEGLVDGTHLVCQRNLRFDRCRFRRSLRLVDAHVRRQLAITTCVIELDPSLASLVAEARDALLDLSDRRLEEADARAAQADRLVWTPGRASDLEEDERQRLRWQVADAYVAAANARTTFEDRSAELTARFQANGFKPSASFVDMRRLRVGGLLNFTSTRCDGALDLKDLRADGDVWFDSARLCCGLWAAPPEWPNDGVAFQARELLMAALRLSTASVAGELSFGPIEGSRTEIVGQANLLMIRVVGQLGFVGARVVALPGETAILLEAARLHSVYFVERRGYRFRCDGGIDLRCRVHTSVRIEGARIWASSDFAAIDLTSADVGDSFILKDSVGFRSECDGGVAMKMATITGSTDFRGARVSAGRAFTAIDMRGTKVGGSVAFASSASHRFEARGQIRLLMARVGGVISFVGVRVRAERGDSLSLKSAVLNGALFLSEADGVRSSFTGHIDAFELRCGGIEAAGLRADDSLNLGYLRCSGRANFDGAELLGGLDLMHAEIEGDLTLQGARLGTFMDSQWLNEIAATNADVDERRQDAPCMIRLTQAVVRGRLLARGNESHTPMRDPNAEIRPGRWEFEAALIEGNVRINNWGIGSLRMEDAEVQGEVNLAGTTVHGDLIMRSAKVTGRVFADEAADAAFPRVSHRIDLAYASLAQIKIKFSAGGFPVPHRVDLTGVRAGDVTIIGTLERDQRERRTDPSEFLLIVEGLTFASLDVNGLTVAAPIERNLSRWRRIVALVPAALLPLWIFGPDLAGWRAILLIVGAAIGLATIRCCRRCHESIERRADAPATRRRGPLARARRWVLYADLVEGLRRAARCGPPDVASAAADAHRYPVPLTWSWRDTVRTGVWMLLTLAAIAALWHVVVLTGFAAAGGFGPQLFWAALGLAAYDLLTLYGWVHTPAHYRWRNRREHDNEQIEELSRLSEDRGARRLEAAKIERKLLDFLARTQFSRGFYMLVEQAWRSAGDEETADEVFRARRKRETSDSWRDDRPGEIRIRSFAGRTYRELLDLLLGFGARVDRAVHVLFLFAFVNACIFCLPRSVQHPLAFGAVLRQPNLGAIGAKGQVVTPSLPLDQTSLRIRIPAANLRGRLDPVPLPPGGLEPDAYEVRLDGSDATINADVVYRTPATRPVPPAALTNVAWYADAGQPADGEWGLTDGLWVTLKLTVPVIPWFADNDWVPSSRPMTEWGLPYRYESYATFAQAVNLVLVPLILAGLTGLLKRDK